MSPFSDPASSQGIPEYRANPFGEPWDPADAAWPHACDYKFNISEPRAQQEVADLIEGERQVPGSQLLSLDWLRRRGTPVRYIDSQVKRGCFIQIGCVITDGFGSGQITHALLNERSAHQFHDPTIPRRTTGLSVVFSTVLASFAKQDPFGNAPVALFNDLRAHCPWALFSRKLLLPDIHLDSRFLGVAYNFLQPDCRYVFLLWHVRTARRPGAMVVPSRQSAKHDVPAWVRAGEVTASMLMDKPIERLALGAVLGRDFNAPQPNERVGFLPWPKFEEVWKPAPAQRAVVNREALILDLLRMYQQEFHGNRRPCPADLPAKKERALQRDLIRYLHEMRDRLQLPISAEPERPLGWEPGAGRCDIVVEIFDHAGGSTQQPPVRLYRYLIECKLSANRDREPFYLAQTLEYQAAVSRLNDMERKLDGFHAIVLLHGLHGAHHRFPLQQIETHPHPATPIHVVRIALTPATPSSAEPAREVAHGIIPLRARTKGVKWLLFTRQDKDPNPRLPGGKLKPGETRYQAIRRELREELGLTPEHIRELVEISPGTERHEPGFAVTDLSMKRGEENLYRMHPFVVLLTDKGKQHILANLNAGDHCPRPALLSDWLTGAFGQKPEYAMSVSPHLNPELLALAAIDLD